MNDAREFKPLAALLLALERNRAAEDTSVKLRQHDMHRKIGGTKPSRRCRPLFKRGASQYDLQHRGIRLVEHAAATVEPRRKCRGVENDVECARGDQVRQRRARVSVLEARDKHAFHAHSARRERVGERIDRRRVAGHEDGAVEYDQRARRGAVCCVASAVVRAESRDRTRLGRPFQRSQFVSNHVQAGGHVVGTAGFKIAPDVLELRDVQCRGLFEPQILEAIPRNDRQMEAPRSGGRGEFIDAIAPVVHAPKQPHQHEARVGADFLDVEID